MPERPLKPCSYPGCLKLTRDRYCPEHLMQARRYDEERGAAHQRGYGSNWQKYRITFLAQNPWCVECLKHGNFTPAKVVDHIIPHKGDMVLFWDTNNHQALCKRCHDAKTAREDGGFGNTPQVKKV
ncbi:MAG: HNH endonuclease [Firmicutes bacterium]|nr:HNH endonuclease [Bacillota bacterium]